MAEILGSGVDADEYEIGWWLAPPAVWAAQVGSPGWKFVASRADPTTVSGLGMSA